jgi:hypothetical protein
MVHADPGAGLDEKVQAILARGQAPLEHLAKDPAVLSDILARNAQARSAEQSRSMQALWTTADAGSPLIKPYLDNASALAFKKAMKLHPGLSKVFSLGKDGAVVATVPKCHDFIHGFEPKFLVCFKSGTTHVNEPALDLTSKQYSVQVSVPVKDGQGVVQGVLVGTFGIH